MARTPREITRAAAEIRRAFSQRLKTLDARRKEIVASAILAAEQKRIQEIRSRYD